MKWFLGFLCALFPALACGQSITVPATVQVDAPGLVVIRATQLDADDVRWYSLGPGLQTFPPDVVTPKPGVYLGLALNAGTYKVGVIVAKAVNGKAVISQPQVVTVTVGTPTPPQPPTPTDPFFPTLKTAYGQETDSGKAAQVQQLAALFNAAGRATVNDASLLTVGDFFTAFKKAVDSLLPAAALGVIRPAIGANLAAVLPTSATAPLDAATRKLIGDNYLRIAADLSALTATKKGK